MITTPISSSSSILNTSENKLWNEKVYWFEPHNISSSHSILLNQNTSFNSNQTFNESLSITEGNSTLFNIPFFEKSVTNVFLYAKRNIFKALFPERSSSSSYFFLYFLC